MEPDKFAFLMVECKIKLEEPLGHKAVPVVSHEFYLPLSSLQGVV